MLCIYLQTFEAALFRKKNLWSSSITLGSILSGPSDLVGLSVLSLLKTLITTQYLLDCQPPYFTNLNDIIIMVIFKCYFYGELIALS